MSDGSEAFRGLSQSRVGPLYTLSTTLMEKGLSPSERCWEPLCWQTVARQRGIYLRPSPPREVFDIPSQLCCGGELLPSCLSTESCPLIEKSWNGDCHFDSLFMNNSSIALWITNQWSESKIRRASLQNLVGGKHSWLCLIRLKCKYHLTICPYKRLQLSTLKNRDLHKMGSIQPQHPLTWTMHFHCYMRLHLGRLWLRILVMQGENTSSHCDWLKSTFL